MRSVEFLYLLSGRNHKIFLAHYFPKACTSVDEHRVVILVPPFAEEMNRSKRMFVLCAQKLSEIGLNVICFDYAGTGDSEGEWGDFSYADWYQNFLDVYNYSQTKGFQSVDIISLRFGSLLSADAIVNECIAINNCIFWDPVEKGESFIRQLIRTKIAAEMSLAENKSEKYNYLNELDQHGYIEIAGYKLTEELIESIKSLKLSDYLEELTKMSVVHWMQLGLNLAKPRCLNENILQTLSFKSVEDIRFWMQQEVTISQDLIDETCRILENAK